MLIKNIVISVKFVHRVGQNDGPTIRIIEVNILLLQKVTTSSSFSIELSNNSINWTISLNDNAVIWYAQLIQSIDSK